MTDGGLGRIREVLGSMLTADRDHWIYWRAVALGIGVFFYFALLVEPPFSAGVAGILVFLIIAISSRCHTSLLLATFPLAALCTGFFTASVKTPGQVRIRNFGQSWRFVQALPGESREAVWVIVSGAGRG